MNVKKILAITAVMLVASSLASAGGGYLDPVIEFACELVEVFVNVGNGLAAVMFVYGGAKYAYTADDPGGRKMGMTICVAAIMAFIIIQAAQGIIEGIDIAGPYPPLPGIC